MINYKGFTPLTGAIHLNAPIAVIIVLSKVLNVNLKDKWGKTPLHYASNDGKLDIVQVLLEAKAKIDKKSRDGYTPLHLAAYMGKYEVFKFLLLNGADCYVKDPDGRTALDLAMEPDYTFNEVGEIVSLPIDIIKGRLSIKETLKKHMNLVNIKG